MSDCVFCQLLEGRVEASLCHEGEDAVALMDIHPINPGHVLVIPRRHVESLEQLDDETGGRLFAVARRTAGAIRKSHVRCEGVDLFLADGEAAGQEVFHVHMHVLPRFDGDGFTIDYPRSPQPSRAELDAVAAQIRAGYE